MSSSTLSEAEQARVGDETTLSNLLSKLGQIEQPSQAIKNLTTTVQDRFKSNDPVETAIEVLEGHLTKFLYFAEYQKMAGRAPIYDHLTKKQQQTHHFGQRLFH